MTGPINPIDRFILARLDREGFVARAGSESGDAHPSSDPRPHRPAADRPPRSTRSSPTRRPEPMNESSTGSSPRHGSASGWRRNGSTSSRYADTHGYQVDRERPVWPWRDWVVQFVQSQPAVRRVRDLAACRRPAPPKPTKRADDWPPRSIASTCKIRRVGVVEEEFRVTYVVDRVKHCGDRLPRPDVRVYSLPRSQVRSADPARLLLALRHLPEYRRVGSSLALYPGNAGPLADAVRTRRPMQSWPTWNIGSRQPRSEARRARSRSHRRFRTMARRPYWRPPRLAVGLGRVPLVRRDKGRERGELR